MQSNKKRINTELDWPNVLSYGGGGGEFRLQIFQRSISGPATTANRPVALTKDLAEARVLAAEITKILKKEAANVPA